MTEHCTAQSHHKLKCWSDERIFSLISWPTGQFHVGGFEPNNLELTLAWEDPLVVEVAASLAAAVLEAASC